MRADKPALVRFVSPAKRHAESRPSKLMLRISLPEFISDMPPRGEYVAPYERVPSPATACQVRLIVLSRKE